MNNKLDFEIFRSVVAYNFGFLINDFGFSYLKDDVNQKTGIYEIIFINTHIGIECLLEPKSQDIDCKICILDQGLPPKCYATNPQGQRVREGVSPLLRRRGVREQLFTKVGGMSFTDRIPITVADFATMLRTHPELLSGEPLELD